ncbi:MAG: MqnA/MqnD/SBP family protein [Eubacteriales bacterium]|nr:MqnA/MqnD/SBP family protein [Eubacteriales bacterium]
MKTLKKIISMAIAVILSCTALVSCSGGSDNAKLERDIKVYALKGPTGMGMAKLMSDSDAGTTTNKYDFTIASAPDEVTAEIIKGNYDIAALPTNLASVLYNKTEGKIRVAAVNTLGVLYVLENGDTVNSLEDLNGKELYATGQGSTPEYILRYVLETNGIDCNVTYLAEHSELAAQMISGDVSLGMLPVPNATTVLAQSDARTAIDLTAEWEKAAEKNGDSSALYMGCVIVNPDFIEESPEAVDAFLEEYAASVKYVNENIDDASAMIESYGIVPKAAIAKKAIPDAHMVCITGDEMKTGLSGFYNVLFGFDPKSVGGAVPADDIYYIKK